MLEIGGILDTTFSEKIALWQSMSLLWGVDRCILTIITENRKNELNRKKKILPPPSRGGGEEGLAMSGYLLYINQGWVKNQTLPWVNYWVLLTFCGEK